MSNWFGLFLLLALLGVIIVLIGENRHPVKTLAWIMVLVFLPVAGLVPEEQHPKHRPRRAP